MSFASNNPFSVLSNPADAWQGENDQQPSPPRSAAASSHKSANSVLRRAQAQARYVADAHERRRRFEEEEAARMREVEDELARQDLQSEAGEVKPPPAGLAQEAQDELVRRRIEDLKHELATYERLATPAGSLASFGVKVKPKEPKAWTGEFDRVKREGWIKTASLYLAGLELDLDATLDETLTPFPFYTLRSLFSPDASTGSISPQAWFDARHRRKPFVSVRATSEAMMLVAGVVQGGRKT